MQTSKVPISKVSAPWILHFQSLTTNMTFEPLYLKDWTRFTKEILPTEPLEISSTYLPTWHKGFCTNCLLKKKV